MKRLLRIYLQPGEKIFINGAVIRVDRKVSLELLNDVTFLLESHVLQAEQANTPLKQLYFVLQTILMDPSTKDQVLVLFRQMHTAMICSFENPDILSELKFIDGLVVSEKYFEALKCLRGLFAGEARIMSGRGNPTPPQPQPQPPQASPHAEMVA
ncbi:MAG: flagellar biosynthesis repressor FlbT [Parvibaculaceae bacterium]